MIKVVRNYLLLEECMEDILPVIKPTEEDQNKRLGTVKEIVDLVGALRGVGAFRGVARDVKYILSARVPVLKYVSNHYGISCDMTIDNYSGRIKSKVLYWISTIDERFGDMILLVKEWARAQNINDPKNGTLNSYTLFLRVIYHLQKCKPAILPSLRGTFYASVSEGSEDFNEKHLDQIWKEKIAGFRRQDIGQRNQSSLSHLLATFFEENSTYFTAMLNETQETTKSSCIIVQDPFDRSDDADIRVNVPGLQRIASAFKRANDIIHSNGPADRNELLSLLCTPEVGSKVGGRGTVGRYTNPAMSPQQRRLTGSTGSGPVRRPQGYNSGRQAAAPYCRQQRIDQYNSRSRVQLTISSFLRQHMTRAN